MKGVACIRPSMERGLTGQYFQEEDSFTRCSAAGLEERWWVHHTMSPPRELRFSIIGNKRGPLKIKGRRSSVLSVATIFCTVLAAYSGVDAKGCGYQAC